MSEQVVTFGPAFRLPVTNYEELVEYLKDKIKLNIEYFEDGTIEYVEPDNERVLGGNIEIHRGQQYYYLVVNYGESETEFAGVILPSAIIPTIAIDLELDEVMPAKIVCLFWYNGTDCPSIDWNW